MTLTTTKSMNLLLERNDDRISVKVPKRMRNLIRQYAHKLNMSESQYIKLAISERIDKDLKGA